MAKVRLPRNISLPYNEEIAILTFKCMAVIPPSSPVIPAKNSAKRCAAVYGRYDRPLACSYWLKFLCMAGDTGLRPGMTGHTKTTTCYSFVWNGVWSKKDVGFCVEKIGMDLSHESTKHFDPLLKSKIGDYLVVLHLWALLRTSSRAIPLSFHILTRHHKRARELTVSHLTLMMTLMRHSKWKTSFDCML
jgi:hypothetical protein